MLVRARKQFAASHADSTSRSDLGARHPGEERSLGSNLGRESIVEKVDTSTLPTKRIITLDVAQALVEAALSEAEARNIGYLVISVVDDGGHLIALSRQNGAEKAAVEIGIAKAKTAAITRKPTQWWTEQLHSGVLAFLAMPGVTPVGGAHPIIVDDQVVGAISTAGGSFDVDNDICQAALVILKS